MNPRHAGDWAHSVQIRRVITLWLLATLTSSNPTPSMAQTEPWRTLPATPDLPEPAHSGYLAVNGIRLFYAQFGVGQPVLLLHGGLANANYWGKVIPLLVQQQFRVLVFDSRGHGRSTGSSAPYSYQLMAQDVVAALDELHQPQLDVVGWSDGGIIAMQIAIRHPERIRRLYAYGTNSDPSGVADVKLSPVFQSYLARTRNEYRQLSPVPASYDQFLGQISTMWATQPHFTAQQLGRIEARTIIADGAHDEAIKREHTESLGRAIPGARVVILQDVSHFGMLQNPREFAASVTQFLKAP